MGVRDKVEHAEGAEGVSPEGVGGVELKEVAVREEKAGALAEVAVVEVDEVVDDVLVNCERRCDEVADPACIQATCKAFDVGSPDAVVAVVLDEGGSGDEGGSAVASGEGEE